MRQPTFVMALGLHGSASTWAYNVVRELTIAAYGAENVRAGFAKNPEGLLSDMANLGRHVVCKTHGWPNFPLFAQITRAPVVVTLRDPRDAVISMMQRFGMAYNHAARALAEDAAHVAWCADAGHLLLRYEDEFFAAPATVRRIAAYLALPASETDVARIFTSYRTETVRVFAGTIGALPEGRRGGDGAALLFDTVTQIHHVHIGDTQVGKWRTLLPPAPQRELSRYFGAFLERFGYPTA